MKVLSTETNDAGKTTVIPIGDNSLLRNNDDFYIPDFTKNLSCVPQLIIRLNRLGKHVGEKFIDRYYEEIGVGIRFYAEDLKKELEIKQLPTAMATAFDKSAAMSNFIDKNGNQKCTLKFYVNNIEMLNQDIYLQDVHTELSDTTKYYTIKIGDFFFCGNTYKYHNLAQNDHLVVSLNNSPLLDFYIR